MPDTLKPCAHCGEKAELFHGTDIFKTVSYIMCTNPSCGVRTKAFYISTTHSSDEEAIAAWNRRAAKDALDKAEAHNNYLEAQRSEWVKAHDAVSAERNHWKALAEALERALNRPGCQNPECHWYSPCGTCKSDPDSCDHLCNSEGETDLDMNEPCPHWQFDEAQFTESDSGD